MNRLVWVLLLLCLGCRSQPAQQSNTGNEKARIEQVLLQQQNSWNQGDLTGYMQGYWQSDSLVFIGSKGLTYGWSSTLGNYRKSYPNPEAMGKLSFTVLELKMLSPESAYLVGKWHLSRKAGDLQGHFSLLWRQISGRWVIVSDHSS